MDFDRCTQFAIECDADIFPMAIASALKVLMILRYIVASLVLFQFNFPTNDAMLICFLIISWFKIELILIPFVVYHIVVENISSDCLQWRSVKENVPALIIIFYNANQNVCAINFVLKHTCVSFTARFVNLCESLMDR